MININEIKKIKQDIQIDKFLELIEYLPLGVTISDSEGNLIMSNKEGARILGLKKEEHPYWTLDDMRWHIIRKDGTLMTPEEFPSVRAMKENIRIENHEVGIVKEDKITWINITATPLPSNDGIIVTYVDITENITHEKKLEELNLKLQNLIRDRDKFYRIIAHDLRNPFATIFNFCDFILDDGLQRPVEEIRTFIEYIRNTSKQTFELLENLLEWSRSKAGLVEFKPERINIPLIVADNIKMARYQAEQKNVLLCFEHDNDCIAFCDKNMIETVLRNLITNAIKYSYNDGRVMLTVRNNSSEIIVSVKDDGVGISEGELAKIFKADLISSTPGTGNETGSGLGLLICKEFIEKHKGEIRVESEIGKGSSFIFSIPGLSDEQITAS